MQLPAFQLERYFARWEFEVPYLLCASDLEPFSLGELLALADDECRALWEELVLGYTESSGHPLLRAEIAQLYERVDSEQVLVFAGAEEALFVSLATLLGPGDHAVVIWPGYQSLYELARAASAEVTLLPLTRESGWALDLEALRRALRPETRAIVVNFPHSPTGALPERTVFEELLELADDRGIHLLSDEVYRFLEYDPAARLPAAADRSEHALSVGVMSKAFALAGLRIGWIASRDGELLRRLAAFKDYTTICSSAPSELLALIALRARETVLGRSRGILQRNLAELDRFFADRQGSFDWVRPEAGPVAFPRLLADQPIEDFCERLAREEGVLLLPGSVFDVPGNHFRIGFGRTNLPEALSRLER